MSTLRLEGKVAIITGGTSGMGRAAAELFSKEGAKVAIVGRRIEKGEMVADGIRKKGGSAIFVQTDVSNTEDVKKLIAKTNYTLGMCTISSPDFLRKSIPVLSLYSTM